MKELKETVKFLQKEYKKTPQVGIVLGSGLGNFASQISVEKEVPYEDIPHFPVSTVQGHSGKLIFGKLGDKTVVAMGGRFHFYEGYTPQEVVFPIRAMKLLGIETLLLSNAAGAVNPAFKVGDIMIIKDHISFFTPNPLIGKNSEDLGPRFPDMSEPYKRSLIKKAKEIAAGNNIHLHEGVYVAVTGPTFETRAEYKLIHVAGGDVVGMSTVQETIAANHMGLPVFAVSIVTDLGIREDIKEIAQKILGGTLVTIQTGPAGKVVNKILVAQDMYYDGPSGRKEFYLSILLDRSKGQNVIMYSTEGGMNIEDVAHDTPEKIFKEWVHPSGGLQPFQARKIAFNLGLSGDAFKNCVKFVTNLYSAYVGLDCSMLEINPLFKAADDKIVAVDCKMNLDDNSLMRHPDVASLRDVSEEDPTEVEAGKYNLNFVKLDGNVGCMVNGAGLAMATMDMIKLSGGEPANFLDVGGTANAQTVEAGFKIILKDPAVKAILINIFGGIVRCDRVAQGVIDAYKNLGNIKIPIIVRLQGTNAEEAKKLIDESGLKVQSAILLSEAADLVKKAVA